MQTNLRNMLKLVTAVLLVVALFGAGLSPVRSAAAACSPTVTINLWAKTGSTTLYTGGPSVTIWGYSSSASAAATLPGPVLAVNQGDCVAVNLTNNLSENTALNFQGQNLIPDTSGVTSGGSVSYVFSAANAGTYLYEAGLIPGKQHQVGMGLYGALIVRPAAGQAYNAATSFDVEAPLVLSEIDTNLNNAANPATFDMRKYAPRYALINGKSYASGFSGDIAVAAGNNVLLRYVNAGLQSHAMSLLGLSQNAIATDGNLFAHPHRMVAETIAPGQTLDALVSIPASAVTATQYTLYDANMLLHNSTVSGLGGMMTFLTVGGATPPPPPVDTTGPVVSGLSLSPNPTNGTSAVAISASVSDVATGNNNVAQAEFYIDSTASAANAMAGTFGSPTAAVNGTLSTVTLAGLASGNHNIYVRGQDALGNWGSFLSVTLNLDKSGPASTGLALSPNPSSGVQIVTLSASGNDTASGNSNVTAAEYWVDGSATHTAMTPSGAAAPVRAFTAAINESSLSLSQGAHTVSVRSQDAFGNWGAPANITLQVADTQAPTTSAVSASPNPNNGTLPFNTSIPAVRVTASFSDVLTGNSNLAAAEGFIDGAGANGTGFSFITTDGTFNSPAETGYSDIALAVVNALSSGSHTISVHAKDAAGNWGAMATTTLVIDKSGPSVSGLSLAPAAGNNTAIAISANASDTASGNSNISAAEYFIDAAGANGNGTTLTVGSAAPSAALSGTIPAATVAALSAGNHSILVHAKDAAGNWGATASVTLLIDRTAPTFTSITINPTATLAGTPVLLTVNGAADPLVSGLSSGVVGGEYWFGSTNITAGTGTAFSGLSGISVNTTGLPAGANTLRVRIRDAAGNWSTGANGVRTTTLTITADAIFSNGFETGTNPWGWASASTTTTSRLNITTTAPLVGTRSLQAQGNNTNYVQNNFSPASATYDARFSFNPNGNASTGNDIFAAATTSGFGTQVFHVRYRVSLGQAQVQIQVGATANGTWTNITNATHVIQVVWESGVSLRLYVDGSLAQTLSAGAANISAVRLGSVTNGGSATLMFFDAFDSKRSTSPLLP